MSERPNVVLGVLLALALTVMSLLGAGLVAVGPAGAATMALGVLSFCAILLSDTGHVPIGAAALASLAAVSLLALLRALLLYRRGRRVLRALPLELPGDPALRAAARAAGVERLLVLSASRPVAFCFGLVEPRVVVSRGLVERLDAQELLAVLCHEGHHARLRVPLKRLVAQLAERTLFWLPLLRSLLHRFVLLHELMADRAAVERVGVRALAGALSEAALEPALPATAGFSDLAQARVDRLFDPVAPLPPLVRPLHGFLTIGALGAFLALPLLTPGAGLSETVGGPQMLGTFSLHGLAGMVSGLAANAAVVALVATLRRRDSRHVR